MQGKVVSVSVFQLFLVLELSLRVAGHIISWKSSIETS